MNQEELSGIEVEVIERYILLLLGVIDSRPIPSSLHLQKELFLLSKANPKISEFIKFERHYYGPYSDELDELTKNPAYYVDAFEYNSSGMIYITNEGRELYNKLVERHRDNEKFKELLAMMKMVRELYDKLSKDELLFLIYVTYEDYKEKSKISDELLIPQKRKKIAKKLFERGMITEKRYRELVGG